MSRRHALAAALLALAVGAGGSWVARGAFAEDAAAPEGGMPPSVPAITSPFMTGWVGEWDVTMTAQGQQVKATSKCTLGLGGSALLEDYSAEMMPGMSFVGHGVNRVSADGKTVTCWWFDTMSPEPVKLSGPLTETKVEMEGTTPMGTMKIVTTKVADGYDFVGTMDGQPWMSQTYRKPAAKGAPAPK